MKLIDEVEGFISGQFNSIKMVLSLIRLEAKLAGLTLVPLLVNLCMLFVILITFWLSTMVLLGYFIVNTTHHLYWALGTVTALNLVLFAALLKYLTFNMRAMSFEKTRHYFTKPASQEHEQLETSAD
jgi:hypothetical protein